MTARSNARYAPDLHGFIEFLEAEHPEEVIRIKKEVDPKFGVSGILHRLEKDGRFPLVIFENVKGSTMPLVANMHADFERLRLALGMEQGGVKEFVRECAARQDHPIDPVMVDAYGAQMPLNQVATVSVPEPRLITVNVWDKSLVHAVEKAIVNSNLGLSPATEGQTLRLRIPELNEERRKELVKIAHKYAETARVAVRHVRRDAMDVIKKLEKDHKISKDDHDRHSGDIQKATDSGISEIDHLLAAKEKEILTV